MLLCLLAVILMCFAQNAEGAKGSKRCYSVLQSLRRNPPRNTIIAINTHLSKARYRCREGFRLVGKQMRTCRRGRWVEKVSPKCLEPCGEPEAIPHAIYTGSRFEFKDKLSYSCDKGFKLSGPKRRTCGDKGKWSRAPTCSRIKCPSARNLSLANGNVSTSDPDYFYGATLDFVCNEGYELRGLDTVICTEFGWRPPRKPYCIKLACPDPGRPENGDRYGRRFTIGSTVRFYCHSGFELHGSQQRTCLKNKEWTGNLTTCQDGSNDCPVLGTPISGRKESDGYNRGDIVMFECNSKFVLKGSAVRQCMENGTWSGTEAICKDELEDSFKDVNSTAFSLRKDMIDNLLEYTCSDKNGTCNETNPNSVTLGRAINLNDEGGLDLVFVIDASSSVLKNNFEKGLEFAKEIVKAIGTSKRAGGTKLAAVTFGTGARLEFNFGDAGVDTTEKAVQAIGNITYSRGGTASTYALQKVIDVVEPHARPDSHRVLIFITDGKSNIGGSPKYAAKYLRVKKKFHIYAIGIGKDANKTELNTIASARRNVILIKDYVTLQEAMRKAVKMKIDYSSCGESTAKLRGKIVGGMDSTRGMWPWQIGLYKLNKNLEYKLICGGALLSPRWVLTAAHCFYDENNQRDDDNPNKYEITVGDHSLSENEGSERKTEAGEIHIHQEYHHRILLNDIALVKLKDKVKLGNFVRTVCLPKKAEVDLAKPTTYGMVSGWGATQILQPKERPEAKYRNSKVLQYSSFQIQNDQLCSSKTENFVNSTVTFCAGDGKGGNDTCKGDSGGAFVHEANRDGGTRWVAIGLVSWGTGCGLEGRYGYYTRVYPFVDWIKTTMDQNEK